MKKTGFKALILHFTFYILHFHCPHAGAVEAWAEVSNARPYAGEAFTFTLRVEVAPGSDLDGVSIHGLDRHPLALGPLRGAGRAAGANGNEILSYSGVFRATAPFASRIELAVSGMVSEQRRATFGMRWTSSPFSARTRPLDFEARPLPEKGRPENFSGAVGTFTLSVESAPTEVRVETLVTREIRLQGAPDDFPGNLAPEIHGLGADFKTYAPREISRADNPPGVVLRQQFFPLNTNAVEIAPPSFTFFDPRAGVYRTLRPLPEKLVFLAGDGETGDPEIRRVEFEPPANNGQKTAPSPVFALPQFRGAGERVEIARPTPARLAPSGKAAVLFELEPGATATIAERAGGWLRVVSRGRAGWIEELETRNNNHGNP